MKYSRFTIYYVTVIIIPLYTAQVISRLRSVRGAYLPHTHLLKSLLQDVNHAPSEAAVADIPEEKREPHHENLYKLVSKSVPLMPNLFFLKLT